MDPGRESGSKSPSEAVWLSWYMCAVSLTLATAGLLLLVMSREARPGIPLFAQWAEDAVIAVGFSALGAVVAPRFPPNNPIGWLFCSLGLVAAVLLIIDRTLVYGLLTAVMAGIFEVGVVTLQEVLLVLTHSEESRLAYFATAMVMAALFEPLKRRIDAFVERYLLNRDARAGP